MEDSNYFPIPDFKVVNFELFIKYWKQYYNYNPSKENRYYLEPISKTELTYDDLLLLFEWKNGSILSGPKQKSFDAKVGSIVKEINKLKVEGISSIDDVRDISPNLSAIWLIFLTHIIDKNSFPIYDMHVFRAHYYLVNQTIQEISSNDARKLQQYEIYLAYFNSLKGLMEDYKAWDEAMWGFGKYLSRFKNIPL